MNTWIKKISLLALCTLLVGCQSKSNEIVDTSFSEDSDTVEYYNSTKAPQASIVEGIHSDAYLIQEDFEHAFKSNLLQNDDSVSISFWIEPSVNPQGSILFTLMSENGDYLRMSNAGVIDEENNHGINLEIKVGKTNEWVTAANEFHLNSYKYNHVAITINNQEVVLYLNGELAAQGNLSQNNTAIKDSTLYIGNDAADGSNNIGGKFQDFKITNYTMNQQEVKKDFEKIYPQVLLERVYFPEMDDVTEAFWLYPELGDVYPATWTSDKPEYILVDKNHGNITLPTVEEGDQEVTLTMATTVNGVVFEKDFVFTVRAESTSTALYRDSTALSINIDHIMNANTLLPTKGDENSMITWEVLAGDCTIEDNKIIKNTDQEKLPATLQATLSQDGLEEKVTFDVVVLDEYVAYIMSYFNGNLGEERGKLAYSYDGLNWVDLNDSDPVLSSNLGNGRIRDPFITRDKEGDFIVLATQGFDNPEIYIWKSEDLVQFYDHSLNLIAYSDESLHSTGERAWAPELLYDEKQDLYYILYSDPLHEEGGHIYYVTTTDFVEFSYPNVFYGPGYPVIDGTVINMDGKFWMFYKDERVGATTIFYASSNEIENKFGLAYDREFIFNKKFIEGPFVVENFENDSYYLYVDHYPEAKFYVASFSQLGLEADFEWLEEDQYQLPNEDVRHGSTIAVTQNELELILEHYK